MLQLSLLLSLWSLISPLSFSSYNYYVEYNIPATRFSSSFCGGVIGYQRGLHARPDRPKGQSHEAQRASSQTLVINIAIITITCVLMACIITIALIVMNMIITIVIIVTGMEPIGFIILSIMPAIANSGDQSFAESTCLNSETTFAESKKQSKWLEQGCPSRDATFEVVKSVEMKWVDGINGSCEENLELPSLLWMDSLYSLYIPYIFPIYSMYIPYIQKTRIPDWPTCCADD